MNKQKEINSTPEAKQQTGQPVYFLILAAFITATLFTAWTEPGLIPGRLAESFSNSLPVIVPTAATNYPTVMPRPSPLVGIVSGHLDNDSGAVCPDELGGVQEKDINLEVASRVQANLQAEGYLVDLLKEFDPRLQNYQAVALVSIHADSCQYINDEATGFKIVPALSTTYTEQAIRLTECIRARYQTATGLKFHPGSVTPDMTSYHAFDEIDPQTPAAIIEIGFMNLDHQILTQRPDLIARGITNGILCYLRNESINEPAP